MDAKARIKELMAERNWSEYRLAIASGLSQSTVANIFNRNTTPSVATLESICAGFGITLAQFFAEGDMVELTEEQKEMFSAWSSSASSVIPRRVIYASIMELFSSSCLEMYFSIYS